MVFTSTQEMSTTPWVWSNRTYGEEQRGDHVCMHVVIDSERQVGCVRR